MNALPELDLSKIVEGFYRRKWLIVAVSLVVFSLSVYLTATLRNVYRSSTQILITPQRVPASYIRPTVTTELQQRVQNITQQILSRTRLEKIVTEFNLYPAIPGKITMEDRVERMRQNVQVNVRRADTFQLSFDSESPERAMQVAARLASIFIEENLQVREQQAMGTTSFINAEAERLRKELEEQESQVNQYRAQHRFELPDQLDANLRTLEQLRNELQGNSLRLASLQDRRANLEKQIAEAEVTAPEVARGDADGIQARPRWQELEARKKMVEVMLIQYSEKHPDVIRLRQEIQALEAESPIQESKIKGLQPGSDAVANPLRQMLLKQNAELKEEIAALQGRNEKSKNQIASYQLRIDNTPLRGIELSKISRSYDITLRKYQDLLAKGLESQLSENMEKKQKGEQFQILDPANFPLKPVRPNRQLILLIGLFGGLAAGFGLAFFLENLDTSFKRSEEFDGYVNVPLLATIPAVVTRGAVLERRREQGVLILASAAALAVGVVFIRIFGPSLF